MEKDSCGIYILDNMLFENNYFFYNNKKYYYKYINNLKFLYNELIGEILANKIGLNCVSYNIGSIDGNICVFSEDFIKNNIYISMNDLLSKLYNDTDSANNLFDIKKALIYNFQNDEIVNSIMNSIYKKVLFNFITANNDNHNLNYGILKCNNKYVLSPFYDNTNILNEQSIFDGIYSLGIDYLDYYSDNDIIIKFIENFPCFLNLFKEYIEYINKDNIINILNEIEFNTNNVIPNNIKKSIINGFEYNYLILKKKVKMYD